MRIVSTRTGGLVLSVIGVIFSLGILLTTRVNPNIAIIDIGLLIVLLGVLVVAYDLFAKRSQFRRTDRLLALAGWAFLSIGLLVGFGGFLLANQVACSCPAYPSPCGCGVPLYNLMFWGGTLTALAGVAVIISSSRLARRATR
jgi:hypothetical protein